MCTCGKIGIEKSNDVEDTILFLLAGSLILTLSRFLCLFTSFSRTLWLVRSSS